MRRKEELKRQLRNQNNRTQSRKGAAFSQKKALRELCVFAPLRVFFSLFLTAYVLTPADFAQAQSTRSSAWNDPVAQWENIKFSHKKHVEELGAECSSCHGGAPTSEKASDFLFPKHAECAACHEQVESENVEDCKYCHVDGDNPTAFAAPAREDIRFSHKQHIENQKVECATCHTGIEKSEKPSLAFLPDMASCNSCHNDVKATNACESCHPRVETMLPVSHRAPDWSEQHKRLVRSEHGSNDCAVCHSENFCQTCHAEATSQFTRGDVPRSVPEGRPAPSGKNPAVQQNVHALNYLFTHSLDLRAKQSDCFSCHNQQTFCAECHTRSQDAGFSGPTPISHRAPDFVRVGADGGQHAVLARRDIESCAACHDVEGRDPSCVLCHTNLSPRR